MNKINLSWIKTKDKLPKDAQWCAVYLADGIADIACYDDNLQCWQGDNFSYNHDSIVCWLALPELPEGVRC